MQEVIENGQKKIVSDKRKKSFERREAILKDFKNLYTEGSTVDAIAQHLAGKYRVSKSLVKLYLRQEKYIK